MKSMNLVGEPIIDLLKKIAIPASTGTLFQTLYNVVDTFFAGKISPNALAAIAKSFPLYFKGFSALEQNEKDALIIWKSLNEPFFLSTLS